MKLFKKLLAVLVSMNFLFSSIAFGTGTSKLDPFHLNIVAQYMPKTEKVKLKQVNKHCAEGLKMGYAYDFLMCYILLNTLPKDKYNHPILSNYNDFKIVDKAFKNSIAYYSFKPGTEITDIPEKYKALCKIVDNKLRGIIFPRAYNLSTEDITALEELYNNLDENQEIEKNMKDFIENNILDLLNVDSLMDLQHFQKSLKDGR